MTDKMRQKGPDTSRTLTYHVDLSRSAKQRLRWMNHFDKYRNARLTCRHFGISPDTFYLWRRRFRPANPITLEDDLKTRRPHNLRPSKHRMAQLETIKELKNAHPRLGKIRISKILKKTGYIISGSTVGRILRDIESSSRYN